MLHGAGLYLRKSRRPTLASGPSKPRQRPTLPQGCPCSTIGPEKLNFRVRDGNGCDLFGIAARKKQNEVRCTARWVSSVSQKTNSGESLLIRPIIATSSRKTNKCQS